MEGRYEDWTHHPLAPFILHADRWNPEAFLPVVWASDHTEVVVSANQAGKLTELARGHFNKWLWKRATIPAPGLKGDQWVTFTGDCSKHIFYMLNNKLGELHIGPYNQWQWQYAEHHVESAEHGQPVMAGCNSGGSYVWWPGENSLYEFHKGHHNGWTWQQACHRRPDLLLRRKQPIAVIVNGACKKSVLVDRFRNRAGVSYGSVQQLAVGTLLSYSFRWMLNSFSPCELPWSRRACLLGQCRRLHHRVCPRPLEWMALEQLCSQGANSQNRPGFGCSRWSCFLVGHKWQTPADALDPLLWLDPQIAKDRECQDPPKFDF